MAAPTPVMILMRPEQLQAERERIEVHQLHARPDVFRLRRSRAGEHA
jgi:hypothetical protein